jgi:ketosteroid isomerase-like protein
VKLTDTASEIFKWPSHRTCSQHFGLGRGDGAAFFDHVADDVEWTVMGSHPLAGHYLDKKSFIAGTFAKPDQVLTHGAEIHTEHLIVKDDQAVVELHSLATARSGMRFDNRYCWSWIFRMGLSCVFVPTWTRLWSPDYSRETRSRILQAPLNCACSKDQQGSQYSHKCRVSRSVGPARAGLLHSSP